jgi:hypothetical protein
MQPLSTGPSQFRQRKPRVLLDELLPPPPYIPLRNDQDVVSECSGTQPSDSQSPTSKPFHHVFRTAKDAYDVFREYSNGKPSITPDDNYTLSDLSDSPYLALDPDSSTSRPASDSTPYKLAESANTAAAIDDSMTFFVPFQNPSIYRLMFWFYSSSNTKSISELNSLVNGVILAPDFKPEHFISFSTTKEQARMDTYQEASSSTKNPSPFEFDDTWIKGTVK